MMSSRDRVRRHRRRKHTDSLVDWWNVEAGKLAPGEFTDRMIEAGSLPEIHTGRETWLTAVPKAFRKAQEEVRGSYWVQQRRKPPRRRSDLEPWPNPPASWAGRAKPPERFKFKPDQRWSDLRGRRWFALVGPSVAPCHISIAAAHDIQRHPEDLVPDDLPIRDCAEALVGWGRSSGPITRERLATETTGETLYRTSSGRWESDASREFMTERNHPDPRNYWSVAKEGDNLKWGGAKWAPCAGPIDTRIWEVEPRHPYRAIRCRDPVWRAEYEPGKADDLPESAGDHVEAIAYVLSEKRKECERRAEAAICGLLSNFG